jgi:hypothetical protein
MGTQGSAWEGCSRPGGSVFSEAVPQRVLSSTLMEDHEHNVSTMLLSMSFAVVLSSCIAQVQLTAGD